MASAAHHPVDVRSGRLGRAISWLLLAGVPAWHGAALWVMSETAYLTAAAAASLLGGALGVLLERAEGRPGDRRPWLAFAVGAAPFIGTTVVLDCLVHWPAALLAGQPRPVFNILRRL